MRTYLFVAFFIVFTGQGQAQTVFHGRADLSNIDFSKSKPIDLSGTWEFYWDKLLVPQDFVVNPTPEWIDVPGSWHHQDKHPKLGFGTYRVHVLFSGNQPGLSLYFPVVNSASRIWINGALAGETGVVGRSKDAYKAILKGLVLPVPEKIKELEVIVQASNYTYYNSGIGNTPQLGASSSIFLETNKVNGVENFFAGSLIAMFFYQLILYFLYHRGKPHLWLALICMGVALRSLIVHGSSLLLPNLFPDVDLEIWKKIEFGSVYSIVAFFPLYVYHLFQSDAPRKPMLVFVGISVVLCAMVLVTPQYFYGSLLEICHISLLLGFIYAFYSITKAWRSGNKDAKVILLGIASAFPFILMEILKNSVLFPVEIQFMYLVEIGVLMFLLFQVYLLANHHAKSYKSLETLNQSLEKVVEDRTHQLVTANTVKDRLLSVMSHDLKSPLNALLGILQVYNKGAIGKEEFNKFALEIETDLSKTNMLVENVLFWTATQLKGVEIKKEKINLTNLIQENINLFQSIATRKKIVLKSESLKVFEINWDKNILNLVLRNLLANAIKFSFEGGEISIMVATINRQLFIHVKDNGVGMSSEVIKSILSPGRVSSHNGTGNEDGTGLGLSLCRDYLLKAGASLTVESMEGKGSTFIITIPL